MTLPLPYARVTDEHGKLDPEAVQRNLDEIALNWRTITTGTAILASGAATVSTPAVADESRIMLTVQELGTVTDPKAIAVTDRTAGVSFTITSADATDTSTVAWAIFNP